MPSTWRTTQAHRTVKLFCVFAWTDPFSTLPTQNGLSGGVGGHPLLKSPKALAARARPHTPQRYEEGADDGVREARPKATLGAATGEDATTAANTAKGVAEGSDWRARNEPPEPTVEA